MKIKIIRWFRILFTKKRLMKTKKSQYLFNEMFKPYTKKEIKKIDREIKIRMEANKSVQ